MSNIAKQLSDIVTIKDILHKYGIPEGSHNRTQCPIHSGKDRNFAYTDKVFHCWVCGESGNAITLVAKIFGLNYTQAAIKLNNDFALNFTSAKPTYRDRIKAREIQKQRERAQARAELGERMYAQLCKVRREIARCFGEDIREIRYLDGVLDKYISDPTPLAEWETILMKFEEEDTP